MILESGLWVYLTLFVVNFVEAVHSKMPIQEERIRVQQTSKNISLSKNKK